MTEVLAVLGIPLAGALVLALMGERDEAAAVNIAASFATFVAAEYAKRAGDDVGAEAAYGRTIARYERAIEANPACRDGADHYIALALAARAWIEHERGSGEKAVADLLASFARRAASAANLDGLNRSPVSIARIVLAKLLETKQDELAQRLDAALKALDPKLLAPPEYDRETGGPSPDARRPRRAPPRQGGR